MKKALQFFIFFFVSFGAVSQPTIEWMKSFGTSQEDAAVSFIQTSDGGYAMIGYSGLIHNVWIVKTDSSGSIQWQTTLGGPSNDDPTCIRQTSDGGYIISGFTTSNSGTISGCPSAGSDENAFIAKLSASGSVIWQKCFGGASFDRFSGVIETSDLGYVAVGSSCR